MPFSAGEATQEEQARPAQKGWAKFNSKTKTAEYYPEGQLENGIVETGQTKEGFHKRWQELNGQASPAPFQNGASENEQNIYPNVRPINGESDLAVDNSSDRKNEIEVSQNGRTNQMEMDIQESESGILGCLPFGGIPSAEISNLDNRDDCEVKNERDGNGSQIKESDNQDKCNAMGDSIASISGDVFDSGMEAIGGDSCINSGDCKSDCQKDSVAQSARISQPANQASFDNAQPDTQKLKKQRRASGSTKPLKERKRSNLTPPTIPGHKWKPSGKTGWELYTREPSISEKGNRSSKGKYIGYFSKEAIRREHVERKKATVIRRSKKNSKTLPS